MLIKANNYIGSLLDISIEACLLIVDTLWSEVFNNLI
jgi:hypothetical protein